MGGLLGEGEFVAWCVKVGHYLFYLHLDGTKEPLLRCLAVMAVCVHQMAL